MKNLLIIEGDAFFINERLKEIDKSYYIVFNTSRNLYEVHSSEQKGNSYAFTVPFDCLDERTLLFARKTRVENQDKIIEEIEKDNEKTYQSLVKRQATLLKELI